MIRDSSLGVGGSGGLRSPKTNFGGCLGISAPETNKVGGLFFEKAETGSLGSNLSFPIVGLGFFSASLESGRLCASGSINSIFGWLSLDSVSLMSNKLYNFS